MLTVAKLSSFATTGSSDAISPASALGVAPRVSGQKDRAKARSSASVGPKRRWLALIQASKASL